MKLTQEQIQNEINKAVEIAMTLMKCHGNGGSFDPSKVKNESDNFSPLFARDEICYESADAIIYGIKEALEDELWDGDLALRLERKERDAGFITTDTSKHISDVGRDTPFPNFEDEGYEDLEDLNGLSCYIESEWNFAYDQDGKHTYLMMSTCHGSHPDPDNGETLLINPVVLLAIC